MLVSTPVVAEKAPTQILGFRVPPNSSLPYKSKLTLD